MKRPLVSVIIPTFNRSHLLGQTLNSVLIQTYDNWECLVVDDGSTDYTPELLEFYSLIDPRIQVFSRPEQQLKGANACRNHGLKYAQGEYLIFLDSDDVLKHNCIEKRLNYISQTQYDMVIFSMGFIGDDSKLYDDPKRCVYNNSIDRTIEEFVIGEKIPWQISRPIFRSKLIQPSIRFNERLERLQDVEFHINLLCNAAPKYHSIDKTDCYYRLDLIKYTDNNFLQKYFNSLPIFYHSLFKILNERQISKFRRKLIYQFFSITKNYLRPKSSIKPILNTIQILNKRLKLTYTELFCLYSIVVLNKFLYKKKGSYFTSSKLKHYLNPDK